MVAQDLSPSQPASITYHDDGSDVLERNMRQLTAALRATSNVRGIAFNDAQALHAMLHGDDDTPGGLRRDRTGM